MKNCEQAGRRTSGWIAPVALAVCVVSGTAFAADFTSLQARGEGEKPFAELRNALRSDAVQPRLQTADGPGVNRALLLRVAPLTDGFIRRHLAPRLEHQMGQVAPIHALEIHRTGFERSELYDWLSGTAGYYAKRGASKAVRDYMVEETGFGAFVQSIRVGRHGFGRPGEEQSVDYGIKVSHGLPQVEMRRRSGAGTTRLGVGLRGSVFFEFRPAQAPTARLVADYDRSRSRFELTYRHGF